jgi:hypothetical protein
MTVLSAILLVFLAFSVGANVFLFLRNKKKPKQETYDVRELLHDLTGGDALVHVKRVAPAEVFIRSPRGSS